MTTKNVLLLASALCLATGARAAEPTGTAVEFHHDGLHHYFLTADPGEIAHLDAGGIPGWERTGGQFGVFAGAGDTPGSVPVCRFRRQPGSTAQAVFYSADPAECALLGASGSWIPEGTAFHVHAAESGRCAAGSTPVWRSFDPGTAEREPGHRYTVDATVEENTVASGSVREGVAMCAPLSAADREADARRLLRQAAFGPASADVIRVLSLGTDAWIEEQFAMPATAFADYPWVPTARPAACVDDRSRPVRPDSYCARDNYTLFPLQLEFFRNALAQPDQLRARVAFALSQVFVTSGVDNSRNYAMRHYQQIFRERAFGNFHDLMMAVTLSPMMGDYLDMANNNKASERSGTTPNENYAREILQLFSIGLHWLNPDGTLTLDDRGRPIPTYDLDEIEGFARVFTGWTYPTVAGAIPRNNNPRNYLGSLRPVPANHEFGPKALLDGVVAPANLPMEQDLAFAHANIFRHPNVGPFIGRQLIQKLVTSEPTPAYVARVAAVFANNGAGIRGDLRAVVRAILTDREARGARKIDAGYGKLSEPVLWMAGAARAFGGRSDGVFFRAQSAALGQFLFYPPSVFNYFPPDYSVPGADATGPEFGILTTSTAIARANFATALVFPPAIPPDPSVYGATGTALDFSGWVATAADPSALALRLDRELLAGRMPTAMRSAIVSAVSAVPATDPLGRAKTAAWLVLTSPHYQVER